MKVVVNNTAKKDFEILWERIEKKLKSKSYVNKKICSKPNNKVKHSL